MISSISYIKYTYVSVPIDEITYLFYVIIARLLK